jgi:hypothetical protein
MIMTVRCFGWVAFVPERANLDAFLGTHAGAHSYFAASGNVTERIREMLSSPLLTALVAAQFLIIILLWAGVVRAVLGLGKKSGLERKLILIPLLLAIAFLALAAGAESMARYRLPAIPLLAILAAIGWFGQFRIVHQNGL